MTSKVSSKKNDKDFIILCIFLIFYVILNSYVITHKDIFVDESFTYNIVNKLSYYDIKSGIDVHPPLYYVVIKTLYHKSISFIRFYSLVFVTSGLFILFTTLKKKYGRTTAWLCVFIGLFSQTLSEYATQARMYSLLFLFSVFFLDGILNKKYMQSIIFLIICMFTHYYAIFLIIPLNLVLLFTEKEKFKQYLVIQIVLYFMVFLALFPILINQFHSEGNNPYKIPPPNTKSNFLVSLPSMFTFPFVNPSRVVLFPNIISLLISISFLIFMSKHKEKELNSQLLVQGSFLAMIIFFLSSYFFNIPYHHRYIIMFFPMLFLFWTRTIQRYKSLTMIIILYSIIFIVSFPYYITPDNELQIVSSQVKCPANVLHETPFSYMPMKMYLPTCNHYLARSTDWLGVTHDTIFTTKDKIDNYDISYDYYIHNFDEFKDPKMLHNTDMSRLQLIRIID